MLQFKNKDVIEIYTKTTPVIAVYIYGQKIWPDKQDIIYSCFYNGYWVDENPWTDNTPWAD